MLSRRLILFLALFPLAEQVTRAAIPGTTEPLRSYCLTHTDGVNVQGKETCLVVHHARMYPATANNSWLIPPIDERLPLELCPSTCNDKLTVRVLWQGEAQAGTEITSDLPSGKRSVARVDGAGDLTIEAAEPGRYTFRAKQIEKTTGERDGKKYTGVLHYSTLVVIVVSDHVTTDRVVELNLDGKSPAN
jgi:hypothetical protein